MVWRRWCIPIMFSNRRRPDEIPDFEPVYPLTAGVTQKMMGKAVASALTRVPELAEWIDPAQKAQAGLARLARGAGHGPCAQRHGRSERSASGAGAAGL